MELAELQAQWQRLDRKLDRSLALEAELVRQVVLQPVRRRVRRLAFWPLLDVAFSITGLVLGAAFLSRYGHEWRSAVPVVLVMLGFAALLIDSVRQMGRIAVLDWDGPVAEIQAALARLRAAKIRQFKWIMLLAPLAGFCGLLVALRWSIDLGTDGRVNVFDKLDSTWVATNYVFGVLFVPLGGLLARRLARRCERHPWWRSLLDDISGVSLRAAAREVERWANLRGATAADSAAAV